MKFTIEKFSRQFDIADFDCGVPSLNEWLQQYAGQTERRFEARTYLAVDPTKNSVAGFYSLVVTELHFANSAGGQARRLPAVLIANLAVELRSQGHGIGALLVVDAVAKALAAADLVGISVIVVDLLEVSLIDFYEKFGFKSMGGSGNRMAIKTDKAKKLIIAL